MQAISRFIEDMTSLPLPYDPTEGTPVPVLVIDERTAVAVLTVGQLLDYVPDPVASEDPRRVEGDPILLEYRELRHEVQRAVEGAKKKNAASFADYIVQGSRGERPWMVPTITLWHETRLHLIKFGDTGPTGLLVPWGEHLVAIDGETQRIAWQLAAVRDPSLKSRRVGVVIHHGKSVAEARQGFYDLNTKEVKPNAALAIAMDTHDPATRITRAVMESSDVLQNAVNLRRRQLRRSDPEKLTISALRTGIITTILGAGGLQVGSRSVVLPDSAEYEHVEAAVVETWTAILDLLAEDLDPESRQNSVVSSPALLAGIGIIAHHAMPSPPRDDALDAWSVDEVADHLEGVVWERALTVNGVVVYPWDGIAGKLTPAGKFSIGGPKEVGYSVASALEDPTSRSGRQIRQ